MLDSRKRLLGGAVITVVGLGTALLFRKPPEEVRPIAWPSGFTEVQPSAPLVDPTPPEPVQPRLAGRIESLAEGTANAAPLAGSMYQLPGSASANSPGNPASSTAPADPFLRGGSAFTLPATNQSTSDNQTSNSAAAVSSASETANPPAKVYKLEELTPLVSANQATTPAPATFAEPAKLDPAQQSAAASLAAATEHSTGYRWSPNRSSAAEPQAENDQLSLAERPSLLAPPPMSAPPSAAPPATYQMPRSDAAPTLSMPSTNFAPAPLLSSAPTPALSQSAPNQSAPSQPVLSQPVLSQPAGSGLRHRIVDGDTLASIARLYYGDEQRARELFELNRSVLRDPELLPIGTELAIPGGSANQYAPPSAAPQMPGAPMSQGVPPLLTPPALEQFGPRTLAVSNSNWRGANEPAYVPAPPANPVALSPWDQQLANAAPLPQPVATNTMAAAPLVTPAPAPAGWPPAAVATMPGSPTAATPQVGWPPQSAEPSWPTRTWNSTESALNWVGNKVMGTSAPAAPTATSRTYLVKPLETWETLAQRFYGDARHAVTLQSANQQIPAGSKIRPGTVINVPSMPL